MAAKDIRLRTTPTKWTIRGNKVTQAESYGGAVSGRALTTLLRDKIAKNPDRAYFLTVRLDIEGHSSWRSVGWTTHRDGRPIVVLDHTKYDMVAWIDEGALGDEPMVASFDQVIICSVDMAAFPVGGGCKRGGTGKNDCLWRCLATALNGRLPFELRTDQRMRLNVGAPPCGTPFPDTVELFRAVEQLLPSDCALLLKNDRGDTFVSGGKRAVPGRPLRHATGEDHTRSIHVRLFNGHYSLANQPGREPTAVAATTALKPPRILDWGTRETGPRLLVPDGAAESITRARASELARNPWTAEYLMIRAKGAARDDGRFAFEERRVARAVLLAATMVDLGAYRGYKDFAMDVWRYMSRTIPNPEAMTALEEEVVASAMRGGLIAATPYEGPAVALDISSAYPSVMASTTSLPFGPGQAKTVAAVDEEKPGVIPVGFYRGSVSGIPAEHLPLWRGGFAERWITHTDLGTLAMLGGRFELAQDVRVNAMVYPTGRVKACQLFGGEDWGGKKPTAEDLAAVAAGPSGFVPRLFAAKQASAAAVAELRATLATTAPADRWRIEAQIAGHKAPKQVLNILWGGISQPRLISHRCEPGSTETTDVPGAWKRMIVGDDGVNILYTKPEEGPAYKAGGFARVAPFIPALARAKIVKMVLPHIARLRRLHTDSILLAGDAIPEDLAALIGEDLGQLHIESRGHVVVHNSMRCVWSAP